MEHYRHFGVASYMYAYYAAKAPDAQIRKDIWTWRQAKCMKTPGSCSRPADGTTPRARAPRRPSMRSTLPQRRAKACIL